MARTTTSFWNIEVKFYYTKNNTRKVRIQYYTYRNMVKKILKASVFNDKISKTTGANVGIRQLADLLECDFMTLINKGGHFHLLFKSQDDMIEGFEKLVVLCDKEEEIKEENWGIKYMIEVSNVWQETDRKTYNQVTMPKFQTRQRVEHIKGYCCDYDDLEEVYGCSVHNRGDVE